MVKYRHNYPIIIHDVIKGCFDASNCWLEVPRQSQHLLIGLLFLES